MLSPKNSRLLAKIIQLAKINKDYKMVMKIENIKKDSEIDEDILKYGVNI